MSKLSDVTNKALQNLLANANYTAPVLAINGGGAATVKTTNGLVYTVNGVFKSAGALAAQVITPDAGTLSYNMPLAVPTDIPATVATSTSLPPNNNVTPAVPASNICYIVLGVDAAGAIHSYQGSYLGQKLQSDPTKGVAVPSEVGATWRGDGNVPDVPDGITAFGLIKVTNVSAAGGFTPGTTALDAAGLTVVFSDLAVLPVGKP